MDDLETVLQLIENEKEKYYQARDTGTSTEFIERVWALNDFKKVIEKQIEIKEGRLKGISKEIKCGCSKIVYV